jgi:hypothetical protein
VTFPSLSEAVAAIEIVAGARNAVPLDGSVSVTVGNAFGALTISM